MPSACRDAHPDSSGAPRRPSALTPASRAPKQPSIIPVRSGTWQHKFPLFAQLAAHAHRAADRAQRSAHLQGPESSGGEVPIRTNWLERKVCDGWFGDISWQLVTQLPPNPGAARDPPRTRTSSREPGPGPHFRIRLYTGKYNKENVLPAPVFGKNTRELSEHAEWNLGFV